MPLHNFRHHCTSVRYRITGFGNFHNSLSDLDDIHTQDLVPIVLQPRTDRPANQLVNFIGVRMSLTFYVDAIDENFLLRSINIYTKPVASGFPQ